MCVCVCVCVCVLLSTSVVISRRSPLGLVVRLSVVSYVSDA